MNRRAFLLVDAIVAIVIIGASLAALLGLASRAVGVQVRGEHLRDAATLLDERLNLVLMHGPEKYAQHLPIEGRCEAPFEEYRYRLDFTSPAPGEAWLVTATVFWDAGGRERAESIATRIAPRLGDDPDPVRAPGQRIEREYP